jgi:hypothetical protein
LKSPTAAAASSSNAISRPPSAIFPVSSVESHWLGFIIGLITYEELCLPFGLRTAPFLFNLFAEALHWILECCIASVDGLFSTKLSHYLDDSMFITSDRATAEALSQVYTYITDFLGVPRKSKKDDCGTSVIILGYLADTVTMKAIHLRREEATYHKRH